MTQPTRTRTAIAEQLLAKVLDGEGDVGALVAELAANEDALADAVALVARLAALPGDHVRSAETRLDAILDAVALAVTTRLDD